MDRESVVAKRYTVADSVIATLQFEEGVAPPTDLEGVPDPSHHGNLVFVKQFIFRKDFRTYMRSDVFSRKGRAKGLWEGRNCDILKGGRRLLLLKRKVSIKSSVAYSSRSHVSDLLCRSSSPTTSSSLSGPSGSSQRYPIPTFSHTDNFIQHSKLVCLTLFLLCIFRPLL